MFGLKRAAVAVSATGTIVAAVAAKRIVVHALVLCAANTVTVKFQSDTSGTDLTGAMTLVVGVPFVLPMNRDGWFETASGKLLSAVLGGSVAVGGWIIYSLGD